MSIHGYHDHGDNYHLKYNHLHQKFVEEKLLRLDIFLDAYTTSKFPSFSNLNPYCFLNLTVPDFSIGGWAGVLSSTSTIGISFPTNHLCCTLYWFLRWKYRPCNLDLDTHPLRAQPKILPIAQRALSFVPTPIPYNVYPIDFMLFLSTKTKTSITSPASLNKVLKFGAPPMTSSEANKDSKVLHHQDPSIATSSLTL